MKKGLKEQEKNLVYTVLYIKYIQDNLKPMLKLPLVERFNKLEDTINHLHTYMKYIATKQNDGLELMGLLERHQAKTSALMDSVKRIVGKKNIQDKDLQLDYANPPRISLS